MDTWDHFRRGRLAGFPLTGLTAAPRRTAGAFLAVGVGVALEYTCALEAVQVRRALLVDATGSRGGELQHGRRHFRSRTCVGPGVPCSLAVVAPRQDSTSDQDEEREVLAMTPR
jgi:hypothetical protein